MTARVLFTLALLSSTALAQTYPSPTYQGLTLQADPVTANQAVRRGYLDQRLGTALPSLSNCMLLGGSGVAGVAQGVSPGAGLTCSSNTLAVAVGTAAGTLAAGNDSRITGALQAAGGDASGATVTASGGTTPRSFASMAADTVNPLAFGAVCDGVTDDTVAVRAAFAAAASVPNGAMLVVPQRACLISGPVAQAIGAGRSIHLRGAGGMSGFVSANGSGVAITLTDATASFDASDLAFLRTGSGQSGIGLSVQATVVQAQSISHFRNLLFSGNAVTGGTASWQEGLKLTSLSAPVVDGMRSFMPNGTGAGSGYGLHLTGSDLSHFLGDAKVTNSLFQGGQATIKVDGAVQGVYVANSEGIGSDYGIHAADATGNYLQELLTVTNSHWNNALIGIYMQNFNENQISNNLFLHFSPVAGRGYQAIFADHSGYMTVTGNTFLGAGQGVETFFKATGSQLYTVTGNNAVTIAGPCVDTSGSWNVSVTGNSCQGVNEPGIVLGATSMAAANVVNGRNELVGAGGGPALVKAGQTQSGGFLALSSNINLVASGTGQSDAAAVSANQVFVSGGPAGSGMRLPATTTLAAGSATAVEIWNNAGTAVMVYPAAGETLLGGAANAPISLPGGGQERCWWPGQGTAWVCSGATNLVPLAPLASPGLVGLPTAPTATADTSSTQLATTAFVLGQAASVVPLAPGSAAVGTSTRFARADHVHPTDVTRAPVASPVFTGLLSKSAALPNTAGSGQSDATAIGSSTVYLQNTPVATGARLPSISGLPSNSATEIDIWNGGANDTRIYPGSGDSIYGGAANAFAVSAAGTWMHCWYPGLGTTWVCVNTPNPATVARLASPALTGTPTAPTAPAGTSTAQLATTAFVAAALPSPAFQLVAANNTFVPATASTWVRFRLFGPGGAGGAGLACASGASCSGGGGGGAGGMTDFLVPAARIQAGGCAITVGTAGSSNTVVNCGTGLSKTAYRGGAGAAGSASAGAGGGGAGGEIGYGRDASGATTGLSNPFPNTSNSGTPLTVSPGGTSSAAGTCGRGGDSNLGPTGGGGGTGLNAGTAVAVWNCGGGENPMSAGQAPVITDTGCEPNVGGASGVGSTTAASTAGGAGGMPGGGGGGGGSGTVSGGAGGAGAAGRVCIWQG